MSKQTIDKPFKPKLFAPLAVGILIGAVAVGTVVLVLNHDQPTRSYPVYRTPDAPRSDASRSDTPRFTIEAPTLPTAALDPALTRVASRFICSCGTCGEKRLDVCSCDTAQQERAFIQNQLREGRSETEAADALNRKFGGLKSGPS